MGKKSDGDLKDDLQLAQKHMKRCSSSVTRELQIKTRSHAHRWEWLRSKTLTTPVTSGGGGTGTHACGGTQRWSVFSLTVFWVFWFFFFYTKLRVILLTSQFSNLLKTYVPQKHARRCSVRLYSWSPVTGSDQDNLQREPNYICAAELFGNNKWAPVTAPYAHWRTQVTPQCL